MTRIPVPGSEVTAEELEQYWEVHDEAEEELNMLGFGPIPRPNCSCPVVDSEKLTTANLNQYTDLFARTAQWFTYAENTLARIRSILNSKTIQMSQLEVHLKSEISNTVDPATDKRYTVEGKKLYVESNPRYIELLKERTRLECQEELMKSQVSGLAKQYALISREVELRKLDIEGGRRSGNIGYPSPGMHQR